MKILLATSKAVPSGGGIASYNQELIRLFGEEYEINLLTDADEGIVEGYNECFSTYPNSNRDYEYCKSLVEKINSSNYDYIINSNSSFIPVIAPFLRSKIVSVSHFVNGPLAINAGYNAEYQSAIIALSNYGKQFIIDKFKIKDTDKVKVVYNFVDTYCYKLNKDKITRKSLVIVYPGGTSISKSVDVVQQLVYRLLASNLDFKFYWLGGTTLPSSKYSVLGLHKLEDLFKSDERLKITGLLSREDAIRIMNSANIFLLPSRGEGCPMTLLEAMRCGCIPIVSDAKHGSMEILEKAKVGYIVKQNSSKKLFQVVSEIITNHCKYLKHYLKTNEYLQTELSPEKWSKYMLDVFEHADSFSKQYIEMNLESFTRSSKTYFRLCKKERIKTILRSAAYRFKFDRSYVSNCMGLYK